MNSSRIAILGAIILGLLVARAVVLNRYRAANPQTNAAPSGNTLEFATPAVKDAAAKASLDHKFLVIDAMATWCGPCKAMEKDSWPSEPVSAWMKDNAVFVQVDVDLDEDTSQKLNIEAMPTVIMFKDGVELKRSVGYLDAGELLNWLKGV